MVIRTRHFIEALAQFSCFFFFFHLSNGRTRHPALQRHTALQCNGVSAPFFSAVLRNLVFITIVSVKPYGTLSYSAFFFKTPLKSVQSFGFKSSSSAHIITIVPSSAPVNHLHGCQCLLSRVSCHPPLSSKFFFLVVCSSNYQHGDATGNRKYACGRVA